MKNWNKPKLEAVSMNAEIGSYQEDFDREQEPVAEPAAAVLVAPAIETASVAASGAAE